MGMNSAPKPKPIIATLTGGDFFISVSTKARRMALLSLRHHVNLANACCGLNEENRVASAFFARFSLKTRWREVVPRAERHYRCKLAFGSARRTKL
jgi:hypothetical protein